MPIAGLVGLTQLGEPRDAGTDAGEAHLGVRVRVAVAGILPVLPHSADADRLLGSPKKPLRLLAS